GLRSGRGAAAHRSGARGRDAPGPYAVRHEPGDAAHRRGLGLSPLWHYRPAARSAPRARDRAPRRAPACRMKEKTMDDDVRRIGVGVVGAGWLGDVHARAWGRL